MGEIKRAKIIIKGKVQGVFFRDFAKQTANKLGLVGWVKNRKDGAVGVLVQGDEVKIDDFVRECRRGPMMAKVEDMVIEWEDIDPADEFERFDIRHF